MCLAWLHLFFVVYRAFEEGFIRSKLAYRYQSVYHFSSCWLAREFNASHLGLIMADKRPQMPLYHVSVG